MRRRRTEPHLTLAVSALCRASATHTIDARQFARLATELGALFGHPELFDRRGGPPLGAWATVPLQRLGTALALLGAWSPREGLESVRLDSFGKLALVHGGRWLPAIAPLFMGRGRMFEPTEALVDAVYGGGGGGGGTGGGVEGGGDARDRARRTIGALHDEGGAVGAATIDRFLPPEALGVLADGFRAAPSSRSSLTMAGSRRSRTTSRCLRPTWWSS